MSGPLTTHVMSSGTFKNAWECSLENQLTADLPSIADKSHPQNPLNHHSPMHPLKSTLIVLIVNIILTIRHRMPHTPANTTTTNARILPKPLPQLHPINQYAPYILEFIIKEASRARIRMFYRHYKKPNHRASKKKYLQSTRALGTG